jgi:galactokinase
MLIDTRSLDVTYFPIPRGLKIVLCQTNKRRSLDVSAYNKRRSECEEAAKELGVLSLRDADKDLLDGTFGASRSVKARRARHVVGENERCLLFGKALEREDFSEIGRLMQASHESLRDDYEVSCAELDWMAESAWSARGCVGARMTGAGFEDAEQGYRERSGGLEPAFLECIATDGARQI